MDVGLLLVASFVLKGNTFKGRTGGGGNREVEEDYQPMGDDGDMVDAVEDSSPLVQTWTANASMVLHDLVSERSPSKRFKLLTKLMLVSFYVGFSFESLSR